MKHRTSGAAQAGLAALLLLFPALLCPGPHFSDAAQASESLPVAAPAGIARASLLQTSTTAALGFGGDPAPRSGGWAWPLVPRPQVAHGFDPPAQPWLSGHRGVDLIGPQGTQVHSPAAGTVTFAGWVVDRYVVSISHGGGLVSSFEPVRTTLKVGDTVTRGQVIGTISGPTHCDDGPPGANSCLHWGVRRDGVYVNPLQFVLDLRPSILLPLS